MKESALYVNIVEWLEKDQCFVGSCPGLFSGGCHDVNEVEVFIELCELVDQVLALYHRDSKPLPPATAGHDYANKMQNVA